MKSKTFIFCFFCIVKCFSFPPEKAHSFVIPFDDLKLALTANVSKSPYFINIVNNLENINGNDTVAFELTIPESWKNREIFIGFEGSHFDFGFSVNGQFIEYVNDTQNLAEWRLNKITKIGINKLKFKARSKQNNFYKAYIYTTPKLQISNYAVKSTLDLAGENGIIYIVGEVRNLDKKDYYKYSIEFALYDAKNKLVFSEKSPAFSFSKSKNKTKGINYQRTIMNIKPWTLADPYLYTLIINMRDGDDDSELEILSKKVAFRNIQTFDNALIINGLKRPFNPIAFNIENESKNEDSLKNHFYAIKRNQVNVLYSEQYIPTQIIEKTLNAGLLIFADSNSYFKQNIDSSFKSIAFEWLDTSKTAVKLNNFNLEVGKENYVCFWYLKNENKNMDSGNFKIDFPIGELKIWPLPENISKLRNKQNWKLNFVVKSINESFWHKKNWLVKEEILVFLAEN